MYRGVLRLLHATATIVLMLFAGQLKTMAFEILAQIREVDHVIRDVMR